ncbi:hypothetical protein D3C76_1855350 [compost metagenome]
MMFNNDQRFAIIGVQPFQALVDLFGMLRIQLGNRFIHDQDFRVHRKCTSESEQMLLPAAQFPDVTVLDSFEPAHH